MASKSSFMELHQDALVIDSHNDTIVTHIRRGNLSISGRTVPNRIRHNGTIAYLRGPLDAEAREVELQINLPKMRQGGIDAAFFAVDVTRAWKNHLAYALDAVGFFESEVETHADEIIIARNAEEIRQAKAAGKLAAILAIENSEGVERSLNILRALHRLGIRSMGLTHNLNTWAAAGNEEERSGGGLTRFGVQLVKEMNRLGMLVDVSHISERGFWDVMEIAERPVIASHSNSKAVCDHPRNLSDAQIKRLAENGGVMGVTFVPSFIDASTPSLPRLLDHVDHILDLVGPDHVGIGSDFDGGGDLLMDATEFPQITAGLLERGYSEEVIRKILGENHLRAFAEAC
ncbi:MAG: dipeptidase [Candidatus Poribacteria bacterium]|nr:dipeptidase [Candidatus Poribacteria bacterium]